MKVGKGTSREWVDRHTWVEVSDLYWFAVVDLCNVVNLYLGLFCPYPARVELNGDVQRTYPRSPCRQNWSRLFS